MLGGILIKPGDPGTSSSAGRLKRKVTYQVRVRAITIGSDPKKSAWTDIEYIVRVARPTLELTSLSKTGFTVGWMAVANATGYTATATPTSGTAVTGTVDRTGTSLLATFTGLNPGTKYTVAVTATGNAEYEDSEASEVSVTTFSGLSLDLPPLTVTEGSIITYAVMLPVEPTADVTVTVTGSGDVTVDTDGNTAGDQSMLTFTTMNWDTEQTVTVRASQDDDHISDRVTLSHTAANAYGSVTGDVLELTVVDDDTPALVFTQVPLPVDEGASNSYTVALATQPSANVTVALAVDGSSDVTVDTDGGTTGDQTMLTFTTMNWSTAQTVTVSAAEDTNMTDETVTLNHTASGGGYNSVTGSVTVTVDDDDSNQAPTVANLIPHQSATVDMPFSFTVPSNTFMDADGDSLTYSATKSDDMALPSWLSFNESTRVFSGTPTSTDTGTLSVKVTASDGTESISATFDISVVSVSYTAAPTSLMVGTAIPPLMPTVGGFNDTVSYAVTSGTLPPGLELDEMTGVISGMPTTANASGVTVTVTASAGTGMTMQTATVDIDFPAVDQGTLATPTGLELKPNSRTRTGFTVTWTAVTNAAGYEASAMRSDGTGTAVTDTVDTSETTPEAVFTGLEMDTTYTVTVTATGDANYADSEASDDLSVTTLANQVPAVANTIRKRAATVGTAFQYTFPDNIFSDADGDALTYTATKSDDMDLPSWLTFTSSTRTFSGTPTSTDTGNLSVKVTASDGNGGSVSTTFDIKVSENNSVPTLDNIIPNQPAVVDQLFEYTFPDNIFSDADGDALTYTAAKSDDMDLPSWLTFTSSTRTFSGTSTSTDTGNLSVKVTASDGTESISVTFDISVTTVSYTAAPTSLMVGTAITLMPTVGGFNDTVSYAVTSGTLPPGLELDEMTGVISGMPTTVNPSGVTVTVTASAGTGMTMQTATVDIDFPAVGQGTLATPTGLELKPNSRTRTGFTVTWTAVTNAAGYETSAMRSDGTGTAVTDTVDTSGTTPEAVFTGLEMDTTYTVTVTATGDANYADSEASDDLSVTTLANQVPAVANTIRNRAATVGTAFQYTFPDNIFSDADSDSLSYTATKSDDMDLPSWLTFTSSTRTFSGTPTSTDTGNLSVKVTASDGTESISVTFDISVVSVSYTAAPTSLMVGTAIPPLMPTVGGFNDTVSYAVTSGTLPPGLELDEMTGVISGMPTTVNPSGVTVTVTASAGTGMTMQTATVDIDFPAVGQRMTNQAPTVANMIPHQSATVDMPFSFTVPSNTFMDADGDILTYSATKSDDMALPSWLSFNESTRVFSGTPTSTDTGTLSVKVTASDGNGGSVSDTFDISVVSVSYTAAPTSLMVGTAIPPLMPTVGGFNDTVSYAVTSGTLPPGLELDEMTGVISGMPTTVNPSGVTVTVTASAGTGMTMQTATVDIDFPAVGQRMTNQAPTVANMIPHQSATVDMPFSFTVPSNTFMDADGDILTYSATKSDDMALPSWLSFNESTRVFSGTPTSTDTGNLSVKVTASDGTESISATFDIVVSAMVTKEKLEEVNEEVAPSIINEVARRQIAIITDRFSTISSGSPMGSLSMEEVVTDVADYLLSHHQDIQTNGFDWRQALSGNSFSFALTDISVSQGRMEDSKSSSSSSGPVSFWGAIDYSSLEDKIEDFDLYGGITSFDLGVDKEFRSDLVAGVLLSITNSEFDLTQGSTDSTYEVDIATVNPYMSWEASEDLSLWASVGYGRGQADLTDGSTNPPASKSGDFTRFSAGGRVQLWQSEAGTALALKMGGTTAHFLEADMQNSRLATELSHGFSIESGVLNTALELGLLMSSADESAAELAGRLHWQGDAGFSASARSRVLLGGGDRNLWGIGGALRYTTGGAGEGLMMSLEPSFGISNPQLLSDLWSATRSDLAITTEAPTARLNAKLAYGFPSSDGLLTPYTDLSFSETTSTYTTGLRYGLPTGLDLSLKGMRKTSATDAAENTILLELRSDL